MSTVATPSLRGVSRTVRYVSLSSGLVQMQILTGDAPHRVVTPSPARISRGDELPERTHLLAEDPWLSVGAQYVVAEGCARALLDAQVKYVPAVVVRQLLAALDAAREG